jgi:hypothetical protein
MMKMKYCEWDPGTILTTVYLLCKIVFHYTKQERLARDKRSSLLGLYIICEEMKCDHFLSELGLGPIS